MGALEGSLAFWRDVEANVPPAALALACLPSDLPLDELAPDAMHAELVQAERDLALLQAAGGDDAGGGGSDDDDDGSGGDDDSGSGGDEDGTGVRKPRRGRGGRSFLFPESLDDGGASGKTKSGDKKGGLSADAIAEVDAEAEAVDDDDDDAFAPPDLAAEVARLTAANDDLTSRLAVAEALIQSLRDAAAAKEEGTSQAEAAAAEAAAGAAEQALAEALAADAAEAAAALAAGDKDKNRASNPRGAYGNAHSAGARIRALQQTLSAMEQKDPNAEQRFLFQPRGHRLEPMADVESFTDQSKNNLRGSTIDMRGSTVSAHVMAPAPADAASASRRGFTDASASGGGSAGGGAGEPEAEAEPEPVCSMYRVNLTALTFGECKCGHPKAAHAGAAGGILGGRLL
jgi:hypothetical protein